MGAGGTSINHQRGSVFIIATQSHCSSQRVPGAQNTPRATEGETEMWLVLVDKRNTERLGLIATEDLLHIKSCELSGLIMG